LFQHHTICCIIIEILHPIKIQNPHSSIMSEETKYLVAQADPTNEAETHKKVGSWETGLCDCFEYGVCHKAVLCACCFPTLLVGQILTRMKLTWIGEPSTAAEEYKKTFRIVFTLAVIWYLVSIFSCVAELPVETEDGSDITLIPNEDCSAWQQTLTQSVEIVFFLYMLIVTMRLRKAIRSKYAIDGSDIGDCCTVYWCGCCSAVQMANQTADYANDNVHCFSPTGLSPSSKSTETIAQAVIV